MNKFTPSLIIVASAWLIATAPAEAADQLWLCRQQGGSTIYTTNPAYSECKEFTPSAGGLTTRPEPDQGRPPSEESRLHKYYEKSAALERPREEPSKPKGELEFEKFRMLSTGMTEAEVLTRTGSPKHIFRIGHNVQHWVYTTEDEWLIEVTFTGGRVANIDWYRPRP